MRKLAGLTLGLLVIVLSTMGVTPASGQLADPLSLAMSGVLLPFFSDPAAGFVSVFDIVSPVVPTVQGDSPHFNFTNPLHIVFFRENCSRFNSVADVETAKQAKAYISNASPFLLNFNGLAAIASTAQGNDLLPLNFPLHTRTHWIDAKTGRLRELEPIILDTFLTLNPQILPLVENPGAGLLIGLCAPGAGGIIAAPLGALNNGFCWSPLRSAATFVTPQDDASVQASIYLICPTADIQGPAGTGVFPIAAGFARIQNRDGTVGFPARNVFTGNPSTTLQGRIYDDDEDLVRDILVGCGCLTRQTVASIDSVYTLPPANLGAHTVPVWYTELESRPGPTWLALLGIDDRLFSFTGYWGLEVTGQTGTLFRRMSNASLDNLSFGTANAFSNR